MAAKNIKRSSNKPPVDPHPPFGKEFQFPEGHPRWEALPEDVKDYFRRNIAALRIPREKVPELAQECGAMIAAIADTIQRQFMRFWYEGPEKILAEQADLSEELEDENFGDEAIRRVLAAAGPTVYVSTTSLEADKPAGKRVEKSSTQRNANQSKRQKGRGRKST